MAALTNDQILDAIASMSVLEVSELVKAMEEKFGVTAAVAVAAGPAAAGGAAASRRRPDAARGHTHAPGPGGRASRPNPVPTPEG